MKRTKQEAIDRMMRVSGVAATVFLGLSIPATAQFSEEHKDLSFDTWKSLSGQMGTYYETRRGIGPDGAKFFIYDPFGYSNFVQCIRWKKRLIVRLYDFQLKPVHSWHFDARVNVLHSSGGKKVELSKGDSYWISQRPVALSDSDRLVIKLKRKNHPHFETFRLSRSDVGALK